MSFKFNFLGTANEDDSKVEQDVLSKDENSGSAEKLEECQEIFPEIDLDPELPFLVYDIGSDLCIKCLESQTVERLLCESRTKKCGAVVKAARSHSDLIPNVYEGGLKVWECAVDLAKYLHKNSICFQGLRVLDLGCGAGIPGILAMLQGATEVHFQDYNSEVLQYFTGSNVALNTRDSEESSSNPCKCRFFSGDWTNFSNHVNKESIIYDTILTAETIYKPENYGKLTHIFNKNLTSDGKVYVASKSNYFGVGGGTEGFKTFLEKEAIFDVHDSFVIDADIQRDILVLTKRLRKKRKHEENS